MASRPARAETFYGRILRPVLMLVLALVGVGGGASVFIYSGAYDVSATGEHTGVVRWMLRTLTARSVAVRADDVPAPPPIDSAALAHGFEHYQAMCVACHGAPGVEPGEVGQGMNPTPPDLAEEVGEWTERELFWITKNGIKMAGMPAFGPTHSDAEIWGIVAILQRLPEMTPRQYADWMVRYGAGAEAHGGMSATPPMDDDHVDSSDVAPHAH